MRATLSAVRGTEEVVTTLHYRMHTEGLSTPSPQSLADAIRDGALGPYRALFHSDWTINPVTVVDEIDPLAPNDPRSGWTAGPGGGGTKSSDADTLPTAVTTVVTLRSDKIGRRATGRMFVPGSIAEADVTGGVFVGAWQLMVQALLDGIPHQPDVTGGGTGTANWCVYSRTARAEGQTLYAFDIQSTVIRPQMRWLRSRQI